MKKPESIQVPGRSYAIKITGGSQRKFRDVYHALLRMRWGPFLGLNAAIFALINALFALVYLAVGGVANVAPGPFSFWDAFFFSVETLATIGYGAMYPASRAANAVM